MVANTSPIYGRQPDIQIAGSVMGPVAVTALDGTGTLTLLFSADQTEGGFVDHLILKAVGSPAGTVARIFICTSAVVPGSFVSGTTNTASNTALISEFSLAAVTASNTLANTDIIIPLRKYLGPGQKILISFGTSTGAAGTGYSAAAFGAKF